MPSSLRLVGIIVALVILAIAVVLSRRDTNRPLIVTLLLVALTLLAISVVPDIVRPVQDFIGLGDQPVGRIVTVLVFSVMVAYLLIFLVFVKAERQTQRIRRLIRALSAAQLEQTQIGENVGGVLVVVPAYNEAESLPGVLAEIPATVGGRPTRVLVIDDASRDTTRQVCARARGPRRDPSGQRRPGIGAPDRVPDCRATRRGRRRDARRGRPARAGRDGAARAADPGGRGRLRRRVAAIRQLEREAGGDSMARNVGIRVFTRLINLLGGTHLTDVANGYRAIRANRLAEIVFTEDQFHNPELLLGAARAGLRISRCRSRSGSDRRGRRRRAARSATATASCG